MGRFKADRAGYAALMNSAPVQSMVERKAQAVKAAADAALSEGGYDFEGHEVKDFDGVLARGARRAHEDRPGALQRGEAQDALARARFGEGVANGR